MNIITTDKKNGRRRVCQDFSGDKTMTEQSHRQKVNINNIIAKYRKSGLFPQRKDVPTYGDFTGADDYYEAYTRILNAQDDFMSLPSDVRAKFDNDPAKLIEYIENPENLDQAVIDGLLPKPEGWVAPPPIEQPAAEQPPETTPLPKVVEKAEL